MVEIDNAADVAEFLDDVYGVRMRLRLNQTEKREAVLLTHARVSVGPCAIDDMYLAVEAETAPDPLNKVVGVWPRAGRVWAECDGMTGAAEAGEVALLSQPDLPHRAEWHDAHVTSVVLDHSLVAGVATGLPSDQAPLPIRFTSFQPVDEAAARLWKSAVTYVKDGVLSDETIATPLVLGQASRLLAAVMLSTFPNAAVATHPSSERTDHQPVLLRRAIEFMDANAHNDIALADIAEAVHVTPRAVQYMFRRHLETSPLQYLRRLRLHYAHQELIAADRMHDTVTDIAARWGFAHTGRFSVLYRRTYGKSPHTTLRD